VKADIPKSDGVIRLSKPEQVTRMYYTYYPHPDKPHVGWMEVHMAPLLWEIVKGEVKWYKVPSEVKPGVPYLDVMIRDIHVDEDRRRRGIAASMIDALLSEQRVGRVRTSYSDSTDAGRSLMERMGFKKIKGDLVWLRKGLRI